MPRIGISFEFDSREFVDYYEYKFGKTRSIAKEDVELALIMRFGDHTEPKSYTSISESLKIQYEVICEVFNALSRWVADRLYAEIDNYRL